MMNLIPPQYALLARALLYFTLAAAYTGFVWVKATEHQEAIYEIAQAKEQAAAQKYNDSQVATQRKIGQQYLEDKRHVEAQRDALNRSLSHALGMYRALQGAVATDSPGSPSGGPIPFGDAGTASIDARFGAAIQHDSQGYAGLYVQLTKLIEACKAAGCNTPQTR